MHWLLVSLDRVLERMQRSWSALAKAVVMEWISEGSGDGGDRSVGGVDSRVD